MRRSYLSVFVAAMTAVLGIANVSRADTVTATLVNLDPFAGATLYVGGNSIGGGCVGLLEWSGATNNPAPYNGPFNTYCIDLSPTGFIYFGDQYTFTTSPLSTSTPVAGTPNDLSTNQLTALEGLFGTYLSDVTDGDALQGFQLAIWSILYNYGGTSVTTPNNGFYIDPNSNGGFGTGVSPAAIADADFWLANPGDEFDNDLTALIAVGQGQNQVIAGGPIFTTTTVPVPSAALGGAVLMAALAFVRRSRFLAAL